MAAPDLETLLDIETQIEDAIVTLLRAQNLPAVRTDNVDILETPRIEVSVTVERQGPHQIAIPTGTYAGRRVYDQFKVSVSTDLIATPTNGQPMGSLRGKARAALFVIDVASLNTLLAYLYVAPDSFMQVVGGRTPENNEGAIRQSAGVSLEAFIVPAAWPA